MGAVSMTHKSIPALRDRSREGTEHGNFFSAGRAQILLQQRPAVFVEVLSSSRQHVLDVGARFGLGIDSADLQSWNLTRGMPPRVRPDRSCVR